MSTATDTLSVIDSAPVQRPIPTPGDMMQAIIEKGVTAENVAALEKLAELYERMEAKKAEREFAEAFVKLQAEMPAVKAERPVPGSNGTVRYCFAPLEDIMRQVRPSLQKHGFTVTFSSQADDKRIIQTCTLAHTGGHSRTNAFAARIGRGPPGCTDTQADGAAATYAKRYSLCDALGIVVEHLDTDGRADREASDGAFISWEKQKYLQELVKEVNAEEPKFLRWAGVDKYEEIKESEYDRLIRGLEQKRNT